MGGTGMRTLKAARVRRPKTRVAACVCALALTVQPAAAQRASAVQFDMPAQPLGQSLTEIAQQTGANVLFSGDAVRDLRAPSVKGAYSAQEAVQLLLRGTPLEAVADSTGTLIVRPRNLRGSAFDPHLQHADATPLLVAAVGGGASPSSSAAAPSAAPLPEPRSIEEVIVTGTRVAGMRASDSAAPIEIVGAAALRRVGQPDLIQALAQNLPSYNAQTTAGDTANMTLSASLRGLSPNNTLVLVNGKRRHGTGNLAVNSSFPYSGSASPDLAFIPVDAIDHVEVLQDGAAAQYGTDAIAGVLNIILKSGRSGGVITATGSRYDKGDGTTASVSANRGFALGARGFVTLTAEWHHHGFSQVGGPDLRYTDPSGTPLPSNGAAFNEGLVKAPGFPRVNRIFGDAQYDVYKLFYNAAYELSPAVELYGFGSYGHRDGASIQNYRASTMAIARDAAGALRVPFPSGFTPQEQLSEDDVSATVGLKGRVAGWNWDFATTYGRDRIKVHVDDTVNASLFRAQQAASANYMPPQRRFYAGKFINSEWTTTFDLDRSFQVGLASPLNVAMGVEVRRNEYAIGAGEAASTYQEGPQGFPGFRSTDAGTHARTNYAGYLDLAANPVERLHVDVAGRYEHYSDFGDTAVGKLTVRYDFSSVLAVRGTISNGFRAPTLAEEYYSATLVSPGLAFVRLPANSPQAGIMGFRPLRPETSDNLSFGVVLHPAERLQITADAYQIDIKDRILGTGTTILGLSGASVVAQSVLDAIAARGNKIEAGATFVGAAVFTNAAHTRTRGLEATLSYASEFGAAGRVDWTVGFNYNKTDVRELAPLPPQVTNVAFGQTTPLGPQALSALTQTTPRYKLMLGAHYTLGDWSLNLRQVIFGPSSWLVSPNGVGTGPDATTQRIRARPITDLQVDYAVSDRLKLTLGASNLFDTRPPTMSLIPNGSGGLVSADGGPVYRAPLVFAPFGINGGTWYGRITYSF
jgi:iron complex outermembrane recepter protein